MRTFILLAAGFLLGTTQAHSQDVIGLSLPLSGRLMPVAQRMEFGALLALENLKSSGRDLKLVAVDDSCDPSKTSTVAREFADADVDIVVGAPCFSVARKLAESLNVTDGENVVTIPVIATGTRNRLLSRLRTVDKLPIYSVSNTHNEEAKAVVRYILPKFEGKPFALIDDGSVYGRGLADEIRLLGEQAGFKPVANANFRPLQTTQISMLRRLRKSGVQAAFVAAAPEDVLTIAKDLKTLGMPWRLGTGEASLLMPFTQGVGRLGDGLFMVRESDPTPKSDHPSVVKLRLQKAEIEPSLLVGHALVEIAAQALENNPKTLIGTTFNTIIGPISFNDEGRASPAPFKLFQWQSGEFGEAKENQF